MLGSNNQNFRKESESFSNATNNKCTHAHHNAKKRLVKITKSKLQNIWSSERNRKSFTTEWEKKPTIKEWTHEMNEKMPHIKYTHTHSMWCINLKFLLSCPKAANIFFVFFPFNLSASHTKSDRIGLFSKKEKRNEKKGKEKNGERRSDFGIFLFSFFHFNVNELRFE